MLILNHVQPYTTTSDHLLQLGAHIQTFLALFAGLMIKAEIPFLGFGDHLRQIERSICTYVVVWSHVTVVSFGVLSIVYERFFSDEAKKIRADKKKKANQLKQKMAKWKRAKKKLMGKIKADKVFSANFGLGGSSNDALFKSLAMGQEKSFTPKVSTVSEKSAKSRKPTAVVPTKSSEENLDFAWPGQK